MGGLAHYLEKAGIPTSQISLIRKHTEELRPPRALFVPFELGRPFGNPNDPDLQRAVLRSALELLTENDGPIIADFKYLDDCKIQDSSSITGWACPVNLEKPTSVVTDLDELASKLMQEVRLLEPWYHESMKNLKGRKLNGLTNYTNEELIIFLINFIKNPNLDSFIVNEPIERALKLACDDLKYFYFQAALARPDGASDLKINEWLYRHTNLGKAFFQIRDICLNHTSKKLNISGRTNFVPNAML